MTDTHPRVVRRLGSDAVHVANLLPGQFGPGQMLGRSFLAALAPAGATCGAVLRGQVVCMQPGTKVTCRRCRTASGLECAEEGNNLHPARRSAGETTDG